MKEKRGIGVVWMVIPTAVLLACILLVLRLNGNQNSAAQVAFKARREGLVERMQADLASASEAEKSAVLAVTDRDSQTFADLARASSLKVDQESRELGELLATGGTQSERELLAQFTEAFAEFRRIDDDLLALAVRNTNVKAYSLAFGPASTALEAMNAALDRLVLANADAKEAKTMMLLAFGAQTSALRIQTLLPPHIAEESDKKMDELEARMAKEDAQVRKSFDGLAAIPKSKNDPELAAAMKRYAEFGKLKSEILALSRENTNVRSLSISLNEKRKVMMMCQAALGALRQAIVAEPVPGMTYGPAVRPR